ncbi:TPA_asm: RNA-directed RNA polymerase [ssRNA phage SRR5467091_2]|uniref:RNA-directed RNA polymerase n=1 Tax=ssRNA phage SRR5467091_2 TaxID=2786467 RepID=A0A8S5L589_9VIRU|nr:RNA-directed RNA polymerase [ssRNA phage SRR5467091_2]DAD52503.1 TPA_asm: RNA-directed RNA polymerase [ssRNA phage SRR5467091_2]
MSALTDSLSYHLHCDLEGHLDPYQLNQLGSGNPLWPDATVRQAACWYLAESLFKKYNDKDRPSVSACEAALHKFLQCNVDNSTWTVECNTTDQAELVQMVSDEIYRFWWHDGEEPLVNSLNEIYERGAVGPGASRCSRGNDFYTKLFDSPLSHTPGDLPFLWAKLTSQHPLASTAEEDRRSKYGFRQVGGNALSFVNKNVDVARGICTEPTLNMWFQLGLGRILEDRLVQVYNIRISGSNPAETRGYRKGPQAEVNRALARIGSRTGRLATIDLESASDRIALGLCERLFPKGLLAYLRLFRSPMCRLPDGRDIELHSMSTMGNGFTFPLMTMLFCAIIAAVYRQMGIPVKNRGPVEDRNFAVFGDDLIVETVAARRVVNALSLLGFRVNSSKSFVEGPFRESCGADFYNGEPVRGVYIKRLETVQDHVVAINTLNRWSAVAGIYIPSLVGAVYRNMQRIARGPIPFVPPSCNDDAGVHVPLDTARGVKRLPHGLIQYERFIARPPKLFFDGDRMKVTASSDGHRTRAWNPSGAIRAMLFGSLRCSTTDDPRGPSTSVQANGRLRYGTKRSVSASWDALPADRSEYIPSWRRWSSAVRHNIDGCVG